MGVGTSAHRYLWDLPRKAVRYWQMHGTAHFFQRLKIKRPGDLPVPQLLSAKQAEKWHRQFSHRPFVSLILPVQAIDRNDLKVCLDSVVSQFYKNWELVLVAESSRQTPVRNLISLDYPGDSRIQTLTIPEGTNWVHAANAGIKVAQGEFLGVLEESDQLTPDALTWMMAAHNRLPTAVWFYSDEDTINGQGHRSDPFFKPAYSPTYLLSHFYTGQLSLYSSRWVQELEGFRPTLEGAYHHDLALRLSERVRPNQVVHIPRVLCHRRESVSRFSSEGTTHAVVREALARRGVSGDVGPHSTWPSGSQIQLKPRTDPSVRIIIPTHNGYADLKTCVDSLHRHTRYPNYRITVIDNRSHEETLLNYLKRAEADGTFQVVRDPRPFNHSQMHNDVIAHCQEEYVVFMNNDVELLTTGWLGQMVATAEMDSSIAGVGALLLFPDRTVQHGGLVMGRFGIAGTLHCELPEDNPGYFGQAHLLREVSGSTAALLLMRRSAFEDVGGFDEERYPTSYNDVDLWVRLTQRGYRCLYNPAVKAIHYESKTRKVNWPVELKYRTRFRQQWAKTVRFDPFYNPNLSLENETYPELQPFPVRSWRKEDFRCLKSCEKTESSIEWPRAA